MLTLFVLVSIYIGSGIILVYGILQKQLDLNLLIGLIGSYFAVGIYISKNWSNLDGELKKEKMEKLAHSEDLVREVFEKPVAICDVVYDEDKISLSQKEGISGQIIEWQADYDKDRVQQLCVEWNEANSKFKSAVQHLNHKKYEGTWKAYINGKEYAETLINKITEKIQQYREIVECRLENAKLPLRVRKKENILKKGEYSQKWINHVIFCDVLKKFEMGVTNKKLELFPLNVIQISDESLYLAWCDYNPYVMVAGKEIAVGDRTSLEHLQNVIEQIENDKEIINVVLEIDSLKLCLKNNPELKIFEERRLEIINQVMEKRKPLEGRCDKCPA